MNILSSLEVELVTTGINLPCVEKHNLKDRHSSPSVAYLF